MKIRFAELVLFILILSGGVFFFIVAVKDERQAHTTPLIQIQFPKIVLQAKAAYVWDVKDNRELFGLNEDQSLPLASVTKLMTALTAWETLATSTIVTVSHQDLAPEGDTGLLVGERWPLLDMIQFTLMVSSNDGARSLATAGTTTPPTDKGTELLLREFAKKMNDEAKKLNLTASSFFDETGLDLTKTEAGAYGSAKDMDTLFAYMLTKHPELLIDTKYDKLTFTSLSAISHAGKNTDQDVGKIPTLIASKTGYTDLAGGNLVIAFDVGDSQNPHPIIVAVLGSTVSGRFDDVMKLASTTRSILSTNQRK